MRRAALPILILVAIVAIVYRPIAGAYFFEDDFQWLVSRSAFHPSHLFNIDLFDHFYRPVIELYFWAGLKLFGGSPRAFHIANIVLHAANCVVLLALAWRVSGLLRYGFLTALFFAVMPGYIEAITWVSALAEAVASFFGMIAVYCWLEFRRTASLLQRVVAVACFAMALLTHESSVIFLALLGIADLAFANAWREMKSARGWLRLVGDYAPFVLVATAYLAIDLTINSRSYLVDEGHYRIGWHAVPNTFSYIASLYVGERTMPAYGLSLVVLALLLAFGSARVRFGVGWMLFGILPFAFFMWSNTSRYQYLAAIGLAFLLADGIEWLNGILARRTSPRTRIAIVSLAAAAITVRFALFASEAVENFAQRTEMWRVMGSEFRAQYPNLLRGGEVVIDTELAEKHGRLYLEALVRWELQDPSIEVVLR